MNEGFILSHRPRRILLEEIASGETDVERIARKHHIVRISLERALQDLLEHGYVILEGEEIRLAPEVDRILEGIRKEEHRT